MTRKLEGKVAVVTGGSAGIGLAAAKRFAEEGAFVFITGRRQTELDAAVKEIGPNAAAVRADAASTADIAHLFDTVRAAKGRIDVLYANAGIYEFTPFGSITEDAYDKMFDINVKGVLFTVQQAVPLMTDGGSIILTGSVCRFEGLRSRHRLWRHQSRDPFVRAELDVGFEGAKDPRQRSQPRSDPDARI
jgi:NAD(P)-dependent dehydrogenase (short-subunit alcohol dehydrogenase family)